MKRQIVNFINFIRGCEPRFEIDLLETVKGHIELLTKYGDLLCIWCDDPCDITPKQSRDLYDLIKELQPDCLVPSRIGNGVGDFRSFGDNKLPDSDWDGLGESCVTMNHTWGYKSFDNDWKPAEHVIELKNHLNDRGINYLLNIGPDYLGRLPAPAIDILKAVGRAGK